jgi:hypothetical protein
MTHLYAHLYGKMKPIFSWLCPFMGSEKWCLWMHVIDTVNSKYRSKGGHLFRYPWISDWPDVGPSDIGLIFYRSEEHHVVYCNNIKKCAQS